MRIIIRMHIIYKKKDNKFTHVIKADTHVDAVNWILDEIKKNTPVDDSYYNEITNDVIKQYKKVTIAKDDVGWLYNSTIKETKNELVSEYIIIEILQTVLDDAFICKKEEEKKKRKLDIQARIKKRKEERQKEIMIQHEQDKKKVELSKISLEEIQKQYSTYTEECMEFSKATNIGLCCWQLNDDDTNLLLEWCKERENNRPDIKNLIAVIYIMKPMLCHILKIDELPKLLEAAEFKYPLAYYNLWHYYLPNHRDQSEAKKWQEKLVASGYKYN
ncbi:MAG: hypothetical protein Edafosvirus6_12 [Edafosvirus sp.]|uniref:Uncharacterized protein n=1 Tax=Edafosvirus sp. TaxID=2487765 RepID=A0A3G4ZX49_9VIRU|nr:MAG: hypothetical protein Edafosvirus6_12 [Edafosvirus sp.]